MSGYDFSAANMMYLTTAKMLIQNDPILAQIQLRLSEENMQMIAALTPKQIATLGNVKTPIMGINLSSDLVKELVSASESQLNSKMGQFSDRMLLVPVS